MNRQDFLRLARSRIRITDGTKLLPSAVDATGSTINVLVNGASAMAEECEARSAGRFAAQLVATARDDDLDRIVLERSYNKLPRKGASAASFSVLVARTGTASGSVPAGTEMIAGGLTWTLDNTLIFAEGQKGPLPANFTCSTLGSAGNVGPDAISGFKNTAALFDPTLTITSSGAGESAYAAGGADREKDDAYRARYALWDSGTDRNLDFLAAGAKSVAGIQYALALEDIDGDGAPTGGATLYVGDANGRANAALVARVRVALRNFRLAGQRVALAGTVPVLESIVLSFAVTEGLSTADVQDAARAAVVTAVNALGPGEALEPALLGAVLRGIPGVSLLAAYPNGVVSPSAPVAPSSPSTLFRTRLDLVTFA